jgi:hypothetical protein
MTYPVILPGKTPAAQNSPVPLAMAAGAIPATSGNFLESKLKVARKGARPNGPCTFVT